MQRLPLISHDSPNQIVAWRKGEAITAERFLADAIQLAAKLPADQYILNVCRDRYHFAVGLAAAILSNKVSLLPPSHTPDMVQQLLSFSKAVFCLYDHEQCDIDLPKVRYPEQVANKPGIFAVPEIDAAQLVAIVFTSGSTGQPVPHSKHWGKLVQNVQAEAIRLKLSPEESHCIIGTVPPQHMYGFESTILLPLLSGNAIHSEQPFYPADICKALTQVPAPRLLFSTPVHLRLLLDAELDIPSLKLVLSATAPLSRALAAKVEAATKAPLMEIYGSTETGQIATRSTTRTANWELFPEVMLMLQDEIVWAVGGHIEQAVPLNDVIDLLDDTHFSLHGRNQDLINIAGKRNSLANLNHQLNQIAGVQDGAFYMPDETSHDHVTRLAACVVAPGLTAASLMASLRMCMDPVFLPRPLLFVESLPRNSTGKLPRQALQALFDAQTKTHAGNQ